MYFKLFSVKFSCSDGNSFGIIFYIRFPLYACVCVEWYEKWRVCHNKSILGFKMENGNAK